MNGGLRSTSIPSSASVSGRGCTSLSCRFSTDLRGLVGWGASLETGTGKEWTPPLFEEEPEALSVWGVLSALNKLTLTVELPTAAGEERPAMLFWTVREQEWGVTSWRLDLELLQEEERGVIEILSRFDLELLQEEERGVWFDLNSMLDAVIDRHFCCIVCFKVWTGVVEMALLSLVDFRATCQPMLHLTMWSW